VEGYGRGLIWGTVPSVTIADLQDETWTRDLQSMTRKVHQIGHDVQSGIHGKIIHHIVTCRGDYWRGLDWWMDLLTTYTHDWELQAITESPLISTVHKSPQHYKPFPAYYVITSRSLATASDSGDCSASCAQALSSQPPVQNCLSNDNSLCPLLIISRHGPHRKHRSSIVACLYVAGFT
jgi:hypothetical protein